MSANGACKGPGGPMGRGQRAESARVDCGGGVRRGWGDDGPIEKWKRGQCGSRVARARWGEYSGGRRSQWGVRLVASAIVITTAAAAGCAPWEEGEPSQASKRGNIATVASLETGDEHIRKADGTSLLRIDDLPRDIQVDEQNAFGATARFREAKVSPDDAWVAVVTTGAAHSAGWLVRADGSKASPAAFQYGGSVTIGPWSADGRYVVFAQEGPAGTVR